MSVEGPLFAVMVLRSPLAISPIAGWASLIAVDGRAEERPICQLDDAEQRSTADRVICTDRSDSRRLFLTMSSIDPRTMSLWMVVKSLSVRQLSKRPKSSTFLRSCS